MAGDLHMIIESFLGVYSTKSRFAGGLFGGIALKVYVSLPHFVFFKENKKR